MPQAPACTVCGRPVDLKKKHTAVRNKVTKVTRYTHIECQSKGQ